MKGLQGTAESRAQLHTWMEGRREALRLSWAEIARAIGMTEENLLRIRKGKIGISRKAEKALEDALQWERGSVEAAVAHGREPKPAAPHAALSAEGIDDLPDAERQRFLMARDFMRTQGRELTVRMWMVMRDEYDRLAALNRSSNPDHAL